jgi:hypothetical protein
MFVDHNITGWSRLALHWHHDVLYFAMLHMTQFKNPYEGPGGSMSWYLDYLTTHASLSPIRRGFAPGFVNYKTGCTRLAPASDKVYQLLAHGRWFSPGTPASSTIKTGRHDIAEILLKVALNTKNQIKQLTKMHTNNRRNRDKFNTVSTHMHERSISRLRYRQSGRVKLVLYA